MLEDLTPPVSAHNRCKVNAVMQTLSEADQKILAAAIADSNQWAIKTLSTALSKKGIQISETPLTSHRAKTCACFR